MKRSIVILTLLLTACLVKAQLVEDSNGNVGIGVAVPKQKLSINGQAVFVESTANPDPGDGEGPALRLGFSSNGSYGYLFANQTGVWPRNLALQQNGGNLGIGTTTPTQKLCVNGQGVFYQNSASYDPGDGLGPAVRIGMSSTGYGYISANHTGVWPRNLIVQPGSGAVGMGTLLTNNPNGYKLAVKGKIGAHEVQVENSSATWADYVFEPDYNLMPLEKVEAFVKENKHLPEIPSKAEVEQNGHKLGEMDVLLLKKVEELTLYVIELNKIIFSQQEKINRLEQEMAIGRN